MPDSRPETLTDPVPALPPWLRRRWAPARGVRRSLARRQALAVLLASLAFALVALCLESYLDYRAHVATIRRAPQQLVELAHYPASQAAYQLDEPFAASIADGLLINAALLQVTIADDFDRVLVSRSRPAARSGWRPLSDALFGKIETTTVPLVHAKTGQRVGHLTMTFDPLVPATEFFDRLVRSLTISLMDIAAIVVILLFVTNAMTTRRLTALADQLRDIDPSSPGRHRVAEHKSRRRDEIDQLIAAINALLRNMEQRTEELRLRNRALDGIAQGVVIVDARRPGNPLVYANPAIETISGFSVAESADLPSRIFSGEVLEPALARRLRAARDAETPFRAEITRMRKDGKWIWVDLSAAPLRDEAGTLTHWVLLQSETTDRRQLESQLRQAQKMEAIGQLTGGVAHDFNNLLTVILGNAAMLTDRLVDDPKLRNLAVMIRMAGDRGAALTRRLLAFARRQALRPTAVDVAQLLNEFAPLLRRSVGESVDLSIVAHDDLHLAHVDAAQLESALVNLAINARDAMPDGGKLTIEAGNVELDENFARESPDVTPGRYVLLSVSDTGIGMAHEVLERAFEPFFTTKEVGRGSGLGLSMVYGFLKQSRGHAKIYSEPGHGTVVKLFLPIASESAAAAALSEKDDEPPRGRGETLLMVEDDEMVRAHVEAQLVSLGYRVLAAANGRDALKIIDAARTDAGDPATPDARQPAPTIDLLFTDVVMSGGLNGLQLSQLARQRLPGLRVLFTSGYTENAVARLGELGIDAELLDKPYRLRDLATKVRAALDRARPAADSAPGPREPFDGRDLFDI